MARFVTSGDEFSQLLEMRKRVLRVNVALPDYVYELDYQVFRFVDETEILGPDFLDLLLDFSRHSGIQELVLMLIDADPLQYYGWTGRYGAIVFPSDDTSRDVMTLCLESSSANSVDEIVAIGHILAIFPMVEGNPDWCVYRDRWNCEIGMIAFKDTSTAQEFQKKEKKLATVDAQEAIATLMPPCWQKGVPASFKEEFLKNYTGIS